MLSGTSLRCSRPDEGCGDGWSQFAKRRYWTSNRFMPGMWWRQQGDRVSFRALIAVGRYLNLADGRMTFLTVGYDSGKFGDLTFGSAFQYDRFDGVEGCGRVCGNTVRVDQLRGFTSR